MSDTPFKPHYMWGTTAIHKLGNISRPEGDICHIEREDGADYIGSWVTGFGFFEVRFPKTTTRELTADEVQRYNGQSYQIGSQPPFDLNLGPLPGPEADAPVVDMENWKTIGADTYTEGHSTKLVGTVKGHPSFDDGEEVFTSRVVGRRGDLVATRNTLYRLGKPFSQKQGNNLAAFMASLPEV